MDLVARGSRMTMEPCWTPNLTPQAEACAAGWTEGNPVVYLLRYLFLGEGEIAPVTSEILREAERDPERRPLVHVG